MINSSRFFPLTNAQKLIWRTEKFYPNTTYVYIAATITIHESVHFELLNQAINIVVKNNDALRIRIVENGKEPQQYFAEFREQQFEYYDFSYPNGSEDLNNWGESRRSRHIGLIDSDLYDFALFKLGEHEGAFFLKCHHIAVDAWGTTVLVRKILDAYRSLKESGQVSYELKLSYKDHILTELEYYGSERYRKDKLFWDQSFSTVPEFSTFRKGKALGPLDAKRKRHDLSRDLTLLLNKYSSENNASPFCVLFSILNMCIWRLTSKTDIAVGTPVLSRTGLKEKNTTGMFINNVPFRIKLNPELDFRSFVLMVSHEWKKIMRHQKYPADLILKKFRETHGISDKLVDVSFSFQTAKFKVDNLDFDAEWLFNGIELNCLTIHVSDWADLGNLSIDYDYLTDLFTENDIKDLHEYMCNLLKSAVDNPDLQLSELKILSPEQERTLLLEFNDTTHDYSLQETVVSLFEQQVEVAPEKIAIIFENKAFTYKKLNQRSNQLANFLQSKGIKKDSIVGLIVDRSAEMIIAILAVLKAGGIYLPIDPTNPTERIDFILKDSNCQLLLTYTKENNHELAFKGDIIELKDLNLVWESTTNLKYCPMPTEPACVIYTSGSTGTPKGVLIEHIGLVNLVYSFSDIIDTSNKTVLSINTVSFDIFFMETIFPLAKGMKVVLANKEEATVSYLLLQLIDRHKVNFIQATPSRMKLILSDSQADSLRNLTEIFIGGESFPENLLAEIKKVTNAQVFNCYGPTEATINATIKNLAEHEQITIGKPIANTQIYILDDSMRPVPIGSKGEVHIGGLGLARGYVNNEGLTKEKFVSNPFIPGTRIYKTGDIGRWLSNGEIEYVGRNDNQVKIRGFRIELGEVEHRLLKHPLIKEAVVVCKENNLPRKYLCAYLTAHGKVSSPEIREYLSQFLPDYMIPAHFILLENLPLTSNGKVDRQVLPEPDSRGELERKYIAPRNPIENKLVQLWEEALETTNVGIDDNFFALGGDSLTVLEVLSGLFPNNWGLSAQDFYDYPTIRRLADKITGTTVSDLAKVQIQPVQTLNLVSRRNKASANHGNFFLTGATGFLGIHILQELLSATSSKIFCLIRGHEPEKRLYQVLNFYFPTLSTVELMERLVIISGDITQKHFGLPESAYTGLARDVTTVIHTAAMVKHYGPYEEFYRPNVEGTQEIINFCTNYTKKLNCISTMSVSCNYLVGDGKPKLFTENDLFIGQNYESNVYVRSKFEAENMVAKALDDSLDATIFRVGLLTGRYCDGKFQKNIDQNAFYRQLKSILMLEAIPQDITQEQLEFTPVDFCAKAIVEIIRANDTNQPVYHVFNHKTIKVEDMINVFESAGVSISPLPRKSFNSLLTYISTTNSGKEILSGIISDPSLKGIFSSFSGVQVDSSLTIKYLQELGFEWPDIHCEYILKVLDNMQATGFLNRISTVS